MSWSVCIFAHNEERLLPRCLAALPAAAAGGDYAVHVMENGSSDATARVARAFASADPRIVVHELAVADKANAWNEYAHRIAPAAAMHVFLDGDVRPCAGAFPALAEALAGSGGEAYAAAALPATGRTRRSWATRLLDESYLSGNLYALSATALAAFRRLDLRLPFGAYGEDGLLSYLLVTDLRGGPDDSRRGRIAVADDAHFEFDSLALTPRDLRIYLKRLARYSQRYFQNQILYPRLKRGGTAAMPAQVGELFTLENLARFRPRLDAEFFLSDIAVLERLRRKARWTGPSQSKTRAVSFPKI